MRKHPNETRESLAQFLLMIVQDIQRGDAMEDVASDLEQAKDIADDLTEDA